MNNALRTLEDYELFLYAIREQFPSIQQSTLILVRRGASLARVSGELQFEAGHRLVARQRWLADRLPVVIDGYGYEVWQGNEKLFWYDCQPHPHEPALQSTHPHHKHLPPDLKHHRVPAPQMSFSRPNLPTLIEEVESLLAAQRGNSPTSPK
jgi:hypothetical protein